MPWIYYYSSKLLNFFNINNLIYHFQQFIIFCFIIIAYCSCSMGEMSPLISLTISLFYDLLHFYNYLFSFVNNSCVKLNPSSSCHRFSSVVYLYFDFINILKSRKDGWSLNEYAWDYLSTKLWSDNNMYLCLWLSKCHNRNIFSCF